VRPVLQAILQHPAVYDGPRMLKPPVVHLAGLLRRIGAGITSTDWSWIGSLSGQQLFYPPNVGGWDDTRWLDTASFRARWNMAATICDPVRLDADKLSGQVPADAAELLRRAEAFWAGPPLSGTVRGALQDYATRALATADQRWKRETYPVLIENALRMLIPTSPDYLTS
jgi:hypothetical protein